MGDMTDQPDALRVEFDNGKYAIVEDHGRVMLLRHGELWENGPPFAKLFIAIAHEVDALRKRPTPPTEALELARKIESVVKEYGDDYVKGGVSLGAYRACREVQILASRLVNLLARPNLARVVLSKRGWKNWGDAFLYHRGQGHDPSSAAEKADAWEKRQIQKIRKGKHLHEKQP